MALKSYWVVHSKMACIEQTETVSVEVQKVIINEEYGKERVILLTF